MGEERRGGKRSGENMRKKIGGKVEEKRKDGRGRMGGDNGHSDEGRL